MEFPAIYFQSIHWYPKALIIIRAPYSISSGRPATNDIVVEIFLIDDNCL